MKVSVIIPVYNGEKTIKRCIESVLNQTLGDIEIIVVNDGSTDDTLDILKSFDDRRLSVITQENAGQGYARNTGMDAALGEYIGFVDADDTIEAQMYEKMYSLAKEYDAEVVQCNLTDIYPDGRRKIQLRDFDGMVEVKDNAKYLEKYMLKAVHSYEICNKLLRREFLLKNEIRFPDTKKYFSEDLLFNIILAERLNKIYFCSKAYYNYYQLPTSHMHNGDEERAEKIRILFDEYLKGSSGRMYNAVSFLAAMIELWNIGKCEKTKKTAELAEYTNKYIKSGLKARCGIKRRLYLTAVLFAPVNVKISLSRLLIKD